MQAEVKALDEIVVTALGIKKESRKLGYAASTVKVDEIVQNRTTNVMTSLEGKIAGLDIAPPAAGAGASNRIRLRGQSAFNGQTNSPLIVINGLPMDQGARSAEGGGNATDQGDNLSQINQDDIESMTILKGATAAALYGSRASNGAIIITTKSGAKNSKFGVEKKNQDPYAITNVDPGLLFTGAERGMNVGNWDGEQTIVQQYLNAYNAGATAGFNFNEDVDGYNSPRWGVYTGVIKPLVQIMSLIKDDPNTKNLYNMVRIWKAYAFMTLVDTYGDVPYTEAGKGFLETINYP
ncbi:TonB-dependent receptor plug domain protein, partial [Ostertagia ostertagi]